MKFTSLLLALGLAFTSCGFIINTETAEEPLMETQKRDSSTISYPDTLLSLHHTYPEASSTRSRSALPVRTTSLQDQLNRYGYTVSLKAEFSPLSVDGTDLQASHLSLYKESDNQYLAFVSYMTRDQDYQGGLEALRITRDSTGNLTLSSLDALIFNDSDLAYVLYDASLNQVYIAGADSRQEQAFVQAFDFSSGTLSESLSRSYLPGHMANSLTLKDSRLYVSTGDNSSSGIFILDKETFSPLTNSTGWQDLRSLTQGTTTLYALQGGSSGSPGKILSLPLNAGESDKPATWLALQENDASLPESKSTLLESNELLFAALGNGGWRVFSETSQSELDSLPQPDLQSYGKELKLTVTNAVNLNRLNFTENGTSLEMTFLIAAQGEAGVYLTEVYPDASNWQRDTRTARVSLGEGVSANFVQGKDNLVFVAAGTGGFKVLQLEALDYSDLSGGSTSFWNIAADLDKNGRPTTNAPFSADTGEEAIPAAEFKTGSLPEDLDVSPLLKEGKSHALSTETPQTIEWSEAGDFTLTFAGESAGYHNTLGFYFFDPNTPPESMQDMVRLHVLFPNATSGFSPGDSWTIKASDFPAGKKAIGFFLLANSWNRGQKRVNPGVAHIFSHTTLGSTLPDEYPVKAKKINTEKLFRLTRKSNGDALYILGMEDAFGNKGAKVDKDFNDAVLLIQRSNKAAAANHESIPEEDLF